MAKHRSTPEIVTVDGRQWRKCFLDDGSGHWFETSGPFGELVVESSHGGKFMSMWWPPGIKNGEAVLIADGYATRRSAMKACVSYIERLTQLLGSTSPG